MTQKLAAKASLTFWLIHCGSVNTLALLMGQKEAIAKPYLRSHISIFAAKIRIVDAIDLDYQVITQTLYVV